MYGRGAAASLALVVCASCTPTPAARRSVAVPPPTTAADRRLLDRLALATSADAPLVAPPARPPTAAAPPFLAAAATPDDAARASDCLSAAVYYEARSEPLDGQRAVAQVVLNRVRDRAFPPSVCRVVYQRSAAGCQFSFACDGSTRAAIDPRAWRVAEAVANAALGGSVYAPVGSATHYHTTAVLPWWAASLARIGVVGSHIFYRWGNRLANALSFRQAYAGHEAGHGGGPTIADAALAPVAPERLPGGTSDEAGVTVHRGPERATTAAAVAAFGVRVHRGAQGPAVPDQPEDDGLAG